MYLIYNIFTVIIIIRYIFNIHKINTKLYIFEIHKRRQPRNRAKDNDNSPRKMYEWLIHT